MRMTTILSVAVLGLSTAALAQVTRAPSGQQPGNATTTAPNSTSPVVDTSDEVPPANMMDTPSGNSADAAPPPGEPTDASSAPPSR